MYKISGTGSCYHQSEITNVYKCRGGPDFRHLYQHVQTTKMPSPMKIEVGDFPLKYVKLHEITN